MEFVQLIVYLQLGLYILQNVSSHPTTTDFPVETTVDSVVYETTNLEEPNGGANFNFETTTNVEMPFEDTTVVFQEPTRSQQEVVEELNGLWNYTKSLDETEGELKSSLNSIVHLAYARVQSEPEETLDRLKNLLRALRSRLSRKADANENTSRQKRSNDVAEIENLFTPASLLRIPEEQISSTGIPEDLARQGIIKLTPDDKTVQKVIHVGDREIEQKPQPSGPTGSSTIIETNLLMSNESGALPSAITAEIIANVILKLLHKSSFPYPEAAYAEKINFSIPKNITVSTTTTSTTTPIPLTPSAINVLESDSSENELFTEEILPPIGEASPEPPPQTIKTTTTDKWEETNFDDLMAETDVMLDVSSENTNSMESVTPVTSSSAVINMFDELTTSNIMTAPMIFLNGTREGMVQFIQTFNILTFKTKMAILFALSISVLSVVLGVYSLGPPIIAVGALGILIPISLLLALQSQDQNIFKRRRNRNENGGNEPLKDFNIVMDLILEAIEKYNV